MKKMFYPLFVLLVLTLFSLPAEAQYKITNFTDMNQINSLTEDGDYIWMCTSGGAFKRKKSDGSLVKVFNTDNSGIARSSVRKVFIDFFGNYWFGTDNGGISRYDGVNWYTYVEVAGIHIYSCESITSDLDGNLWFGVEGGVLKYSNNKWTYYQLPGAGRSIGSLVADDLGNIWAGIAGINGAGIWKINPEGVITKIGGPGNIFNDVSSPYSIAKDNNNNIWFGNWGGIASLIKYNLITDQWTEYSGMSTVMSMSFDNAGNLWIGTDVGVVKYNGTDFSTVVGSGRTGFNESLVMDILADSQGKVWIGSYKGLAQFNQSTNQWTTPILLNAIPSNYVETVVVDSNNKLWAFGQIQNYVLYNGTAWSTIENNSSTSFYWPKKVAIDENNNKYFSMPAYPDSSLRVFKVDNNNNTTAYVISGKLEYAFPQEVVTDLRYDPIQKKVWIATKYGLFWFKTTNNTYGKYTQTPGGLKSNELTSVAINGNKVWYGTANDGIGFLNQDNNTWTGFSFSDGLQSNYAGDMVFDSNNNLWFIGNGLMKYDGSKFEHWDIPQVGPSNIACDHYDNIWLGGYGAIAKFKNGNFRILKIADGLIENEAGDIYVDPSNNIWIPTGFKGISKLTLQAPGAEFTSNISCLPGSTILTNTSQKTDALTTYEWDIDNDGSVEYTTKDAEHVFPAKGTYTVKLTAKNDDLSTSVVHQVKVLEAPNASLNYEGDHSICYGDFKDVIVNINNPDPLLNYQISWNNGFSGTQSIRVSENGEYYAVVNNGQCETQTASLNLAINKPFAEEKICMVTVDQTSGKNLIVWERTADAGIESYNVYKLFGNTYVPIGNVSSHDISEYIDYNSSPEALAARYAISSIDTCGNESAKSPYHQTIHLGASIGIKPNTIVLDWSNYIDEGKIWQPAWYYIYGGNEANLMNLLDSISSAFTQWTDLNPGENKYYQVVVNKSDPCSPKLYNSKKGTGGPFVHSLSNLEDNRLRGTGINGVSSNSGISVYPNPLNTEASVKWNNPSNSVYTLKIYDLRGSCIRIIGDIHNSEYTLLRGDLQQGAYIIELTGEKNYKTRLFVQ